MIFFIRAFVLALLSVLTPCTCARAQIVNIEDKRKALDSLGWFGQLDVNGSLTKNNNTVITVGGALRLDRLGQRGNVLFLSDYKLVQVSGDNATNAGFLHARYGWEIKDGWRWETFTQVQYNEQLRLNLRFLVGSGIRRRLYRNGQSRAYLGVLYMHEYDEMTDSEIVYRDHRMSNYFTIRAQLTPTISLASTSYYQPRLPDFTVPRISSVASVAVTFSNSLRFTSNFSLTYDERVNRDFPEVPATVFTWLNGLRIIF
ncbi:DUF481 domain-containing protein [Neolewinella aurantiaca]|uniref:DUF481 domain-containing protein n=1 Tax=Neolewinella aurantiaca TaxID=2602767 RepID=A0A5C7FMS9_9BACT|nr:DUF481 domain-containing protein [Neolewinella aurantiaca]TXF91434.1 DUF481 domain-containing protein [Neolewinella aurantiaca]